MIDRSTDQDGREERKQDLQEQILVPQHIRFEYVDDDGDDVGSDDDDENELEQFDLSPHAFEVSCGQW